MPPQPKKAPNTLLQFHQLAQLVLPEKVLELFDLEEVQELGEVKHKRDAIYFHLREKHHIPDGYTDSDIESKGFDPPTTIQDFPLRGKAVFLVIHRRRYRLKSDKSKSLINTYDFLAQGIRLTK